MIDSVIQAFRDMVPDEDIKITEFIVTRKLYIGLLILTEEPGCLEMVKLNEHNGKPEWRYIWFDQDQRAEKFVLKFVLYSALKYYLDEENINGYLSKLAEESKAMATIQADGHP